MPHRHTRARTSTTGLVALAALSLASGQALAAEYRGRNVDGRAYVATVSNNDYGTYHGVEIKFQGERAYVTFSRGGRLTLILDDEHIVDPRAITAQDHLRGITWEISVKGMRAG
jgi:hypothetical protein